MKHRERMNGILTMIAAVVVMVFAWAGRYTTGWQWMLYLWTAVYVFADGALRAMGCVYQIED